MEEIKSIDSKEFLNDQLNDQWIYWYLIPNGGGSQNNWSIFLHPLHSFQTIEGFYKLSNSIEKPSKLLKGCRYYIFRKGFKPLWEDISVKNCKMISTEIEKDNKKNQEIDEKFIEVSIKIFNNNFEGSNSIIGIEFSSRNDTWKISFWIKNESDFIFKILNKLNLIF